MILILRIVTYAEMLWILQPVLFNKFSKIQYVLLGTIIISIIFSGYPIIYDIDRYKNTLNLYKML